MKLIFIFGMPASGKLTVANELSRLTGYKVFHNHLVVDLLLSVFDFGSKPFVELREEIWLSVFKQACETNIPGLIFTFAPESTVRPGFPQQALHVIENAGGTCEFVELTCPFPELKARMNNESRRQFQKMTSVEDFERLHAQGSLDAYYMPQAKIIIDTSTLPPAQAAERIARQLSFGSVRTRL
jgi:hypothetical protein